MSRTSIALMADIVFASLESLLWASSSVSSVLEIHLKRWNLGGSKTCMHGEYGRNITRDVPAVILLRIRKTLGYFWAGLFELVMHHN